MELIKACRICLVTGVKMNDLRCYPLVNYCEAIVGMTDPVVMDLPPYACYECTAYIRNTFFFKERCLRGQATLYQILRLTGKITETSINSVDRLNLNLISNLKHYSIADNSINISNEDIDNCKVKDEPCNEFDLQEVKDVVVEGDDVFKDEIEFDDAASPVHFSSDDVDEPLSIHKSNGDKVQKKTEKKKGRKRKADVSAEIKDEEAMEEGKLEVEESGSSPTKKRGRPKKGKARTKKAQPSITGGVEDSEIHLEEYVTVIKLSKEEQLEEIEKRQRSSNYRNSQYKCDQCFKGFIDADAWQHHVSKHKPTPGDVECPICKFRFKTKRNLQKHTSIHEKKYACKSCSYVSRTTTQAKQHQRWHKGVTYKCQYCDEVFTKSTSYLSHVRIKHPSEFICSVCGYSFVSQLGLNMHKAIMHKQQDVEKEEWPKDDEGPFCAVCDVKFVSMEAYRRHMVTSAKHIENDFKNGCRVCGETFDDGEELREHHRREHARQRPKNYGKKPHITEWPAACQHCSETIPNAREYWSHFRRAHPDKPYPVQKNYVCDICGKRFRGNSLLVYHKRTHTEERAYKCSQCPKAFFNRTNLQTHEKTTHSDHRPYPCSVCFKAFKCKFALERHLQLHTGVKPYECSVCGKAFGQSNSRKLHVRTVHLRQPAPYVSRARQERARGKMALRTEPSRLSKNKL